MFQRKEAKEKNKEVFINVSDIKLNEDALSLLPKYFYKELNIIPIKINYNKKIVDIVCKFSIKAEIKEYIRFICGFNINFFYTKDEEKLEEYITSVLENKCIQYLNNDLRIMENELNKNITDSPAIRLVDTILKEAIKSKSSDIHIEPFKDFYKIRFRIDGRLREFFKLNKISYNAVVTRIKVLSKIDISEKRLPQDGRFSKREYNKFWDLRISTMPTVNGEKIVIRIFQDEDKSESIEDIGLTGRNIDLVNRLLSLESGIVIVAGPTGSGKSTTLYTLLKQLDIKSKNIVTIEDPVEQSMEDITQINVNQTIGFDFASGLRSILRQDPDVIMVGEIRDKETASIAMRAGITGHMVFSTIHTFDSASVIERLLDMDIEPYMIASGIKAIISQRLVRKVCKNCSIKYSPDDFEINFLNIPTSHKLTKGNGCEKCGNTGYYGRTGVFEIMEIKSEYKKYILDKKGSSFIKNDIYTLDKACKDLARNGLTTVKEVMNICQ